MKTDLWFIRMAGHALGALVTHDPVVHVVCRDDDPAVTLLFLPEWLYFFGCGYSNLPCCERALRATFTLRLTV